MPRSVQSVAPLARSLLSRFSATSFINFLVPRSGYRVERDLAYGAGSRRRLDLYVPQPHVPQLHVPEPRPSALPIAMFFYGGAWRMGSRHPYLFVGEAFAAAGFVVAIPDYRVFPEVRFPGFLEDAALAVRWAIDHAAIFGGDPTRLVLIGHSAGAHIAAMLTLDRRWLGGVGLDPSRRLRGTVGLAGPYDFLPLRDPTLKTIFGPEEDRPQTQPINFVAAGAPPMLLATGTADRSVDPGNTTRLAARLRAVGGTVVEHHYPRVNHITILGAIARPLRLLAPIHRDIVRFAREQCTDTAVARVESHVPLAAHKTS